MYSQVGLILQSAADHVRALERMLTEPMMTIAPWTIGRSILEATALAMWLLEVPLERHARVARSMTLRLNDLREQLTLAHAVDGLQLNVPQIERRIEIVVSQAQKLGLIGKTDRKGRVLSFGESIPSGSELAKRAFNAEMMYRLLSAAEHNKSWAIMQLSNRRVDQNLLEPHLPVEGAIVLLLLSVEWYAHPVWNLFTLNGWDLNSLASILESQFDQAGLNEARKFCRTLRPIPKRADQS
jgi:hypothetical protein